MRLRQLFDSALTNIAGNAFDLLRGAEKQTTKKAEKEVGAPATAKVVPQAKVAAKEKEKDKKVKHASFCFGRMNPPHYGHQSLFRAVEANSKGGDWFVFTSKSYDKKKNPIPYAEKVEWIQTLNPKLGDHFVTDPSIKTFLQAAAWLYSQGYTSATFVAGDEDMPAMQPPLEQYNGVQSSHGFYKFEPFDFYENPRETSATSARQAAIDNDPKAFAAATKVPSTLTVNGKTLFQAVRAGLGLQESTMKDVNDVVRSLRESGTKKIDKTQKAAIQNAITIPALNMSTGSGGAYMNYRMGIALAGAPDYPTKMEADNWIGGDPLLSTYTEEEFNMIKAAAAQVGAGTIQDWSGNRSAEVADVNKTSAVAKVKRNKYGI